MYKQQISLKARALRFLSMREHSRVELEKKLTPYVQEGDNLIAILDFLESAKYLSDERFSESLVHRRQSRFGNQKILSELQSHGLSKDNIAQLKENLIETEVERAKELLYRKYASAPVSQLEKNKQMKFLLQRGFSMSSVTQAIKASREEFE